MSRVRFTNLQFFNDCFLTFYLHEGIHRNGVRYLIHLGLMGYTLCAYCSQMRGIFFWPVAQQMNRFVFRAVKGMTLLWVG